MINKIVNSKIFLYFILLPIFALRNLGTKEVRFGIYVNELKADNLIPLKVFKTTYTTIDKIINLTKSNKLHQVLMLIWNDEVLNYLATSIKLDIERGSSFPYCGFNVKDIVLDVITNKIMLVVTVKSCDKKVEKTFYIVLFGNKKGK